MNWTCRYLLASLPAVVTVGGWQLARWAYNYFGCRSMPKGLEPCFAGSVEITPLVGFGLFWLQLLSWVCIPLAVWLLFAVYATHLKARRAAAD
jgi:hypothetical protein